MKLTFLTTAFLLSSVALGHPHPEADAKPIFGSGTSLVERAIGSICKAPEGIGKCANTSACVGITYNNLCPKDTADVKCCLELKCQPPKGNGFCRSKSRNSCSGGTFVSGHCPGSVDIVCCVKGAQPPSIQNPPLQVFPGLVKTVYCYANKPGEHGKGRALDLMVTPHASQGRNMAEWTMQNYKSLNVMHVIWEQRIWNPSRDKQASWTKWRKMENRGSCTANHCDHVHVSFN